MNRDHLKHLVAPPKPKKSKYGNKKITLNGITFDSKGEYQRHCNLVIQEKAGMIKNLQRQVTFNLCVNKHHICKYIADWTYNLCDDGTYVVEDFKGVQTDLFKVKEKLMFACHGINIWVNKNVTANCLTEYPKN